MTFSNKCSRRRGTRSGNFLTENLKNARGTIFHDWVLCWSNQQYAKSGNLRIKVEDQMYHLHSHFLSFWTDYFNSSFNSDDVMNLTNLKKSSFDMIVNFLYNGILPLNNENVKDVLFAADELRIECIIEACCNFILLHLSEIEGVVEILDLLCRREFPPSVIQLRTRIIEKWNRIHHMDVLRIIFAHHIPELESIVDLLEFLANASQQWMVQIRRQIIRKSNLIYSADVLPKLSISVLKNIVCYGKNGDRNIIDICHKWVSADIDGRFHYIPELVNSIGGRDMNSNPVYHMSLDTEDIRRIFYDLLRSYVDEKNEKEQFLEQLELTINSTDKAIINEMLEQPTVEQLYLKHWRHRMKILRYSARKSDIIVKVQNIEFPLETWMLSVSSKFFNALPPNSAFVELELQREDFESVLNFMYGKVLHITSKNLHNVIRASRYLKISSCGELVYEYISKNLPKLSDMFELLNVCSDQRDKNYNLIKNQIVKNFSTADKQLISCLHIDCLKSVVSSNFLRVTNEDRLAICQEWIMHDILNRWIYGPELMKSISRYFSDNNIEIVSKFNINLREQLRICLFNIDNNNDEDFDMELRIDAFVSTPFEIRLPLLDPCPEKLNSSRNTVQKKLQFGIPFSIKLYPLECKSI